MSTARAELPGVTPDAPGRICTKIGVIQVTVDQISEVINQCRGISVNSIRAQVRLCDPHRLMARSWSTAPRNAKY